MTEIAERADAAADLRNQLVFAENGSSVRLVMVDGEIVVQDGACTKVDEAAVLSEARTVLEEFLERHARVEDEARELEPYPRAVYERCVAEARPGLGVCV